MNDPEYLQSLAERSIARDCFDRRATACLQAITYIPMARSFVYLAVVLDWFRRRVLSWCVSITMEAAFCVES